MRLADQSAVWGCVVAVGEPFEEVGDAEEADDALGVGYVGVCEEPLGRWVGVQYDSWSFWEGGETIGVVYQFYFCGVNGEEECAEVRVWMEDCV